MDKSEIAKHQATRQFRHNDDNSPDVFNPEQGFVIAYDRDVIDAHIAELREELFNTTADLETVQAQLEAVRKEYMKHVRAEKSPVLVLDSIGWTVGCGTLQLLDAERNAATLHTKESLIADNLELKERIAELERQNDAACAIVTKTHALRGCQRRPARIAILKALGKHD